ncbi:MAG: glycosyltransferase [Actinobacteria bacterium]|nr:glycosyltransferase [Actinomycetota bacterium]
MKAAPKAFHIVLNGVVEDSRVLKCAWSLGNAGWDVLVCGSTPTGKVDKLSIGYAQIKLLPLKFTFSGKIIARILRKIRFIWRKTLEKLNPNSKPLIPNYHRSLKALTPIAIEFSPDVIHAHDYTALPIATEITQLLRAQGKKVSLIYDAHEYVPGVSHLTKPLVNAYTEAERAGVKIADALLSVSEPMSDLLMPHLQIKKRPIIVANDPLVAGQQRAKRNLRNECGIDKKTPLLVYSGAVAPQRGISTAIAALRIMPNLHLALIANPENETVKQLQIDAAGIADRFHVAPYVPNSELVSFLSTANIGLIPLHHKLNHEISLITKFGEYMQAKLPIVVSDVKTMSTEVKRLKNGEVFKAEDVADFVTATQKILANEKNYRKVYTKSVLGERSWERQAKVLVDLYNKLAGVRPKPRKAKTFTVKY